MRRHKTYQTEYARGVRAAQQLIEDWLLSDVGSLPADYLDRHLAVAQRCAGAGTKTALEQAFHQGFADALEDAMGVAAALTQL